MSVNNCVIKEVDIFSSFACCPDCGKVNTWNTGKMLLIRYKFGPLWAMNITLWEDETNVLVQSGIMF